MTTPRQDLLDRERKARARLDAFCNIADHALVLRRLIRADFDVARSLDLNLLRDAADVQSLRICESRPSDGTRTRSRCASRRSLTHNESKVLPVPQAIMS